MRGHLVAVVGVHDQLERPRVVAPGDLGVGHRVVVTRLPGDEAGEARAAALDQVQPQVVVQRAVPVGSLRGGQQARDLGDVGRRHLPLDLEAAHAREATGAPPDRRAAVRAP